MTKKILFSSIISLSLFFAVSDVHAIPLLEKVPWNAETGEKGSITGQTFKTYIPGIYNFLLAGVVISALLMVTIGGFMYLTSAGNQAQAGTAKKVITDALLGLVVVFFTYLILNTINPDLLNIKDPGINLKDSVEAAKDATNKAP